MYRIVVIYPNGTEKTWSERDTVKGAKIALANAKRKAAKYGYVACEIRDAA